MRETEKRIKAYKAMLPRMKERVVAALSLLAVAITTMVSSTYAWLVLSQSPEVKGLQTTIAANGNLEIALAGRVVNGVFMPPAESAVGDGLLGIVDKNLTWGNLVNLGDPYYGLENIILRPAKLNENDLANSPLYAATYGADGRIEELFSDFGYTYAKDGLFKTRDQIVKESTEAEKQNFKEYGVRAVSSVVYSFSGTPTVRQEKLAELSDTAGKSILVPKNSLQNVVAENSEGDKALRSLMDLMGKYISAQVDEALNSKIYNVSVTKDELEQIIVLFDLLIQVSEESVDALADVYDFEVYLRTDSLDGRIDFKTLLTQGTAFSDVETLLTRRNNNGELIIDSKIIEQLRQLWADYAILKTNAKKLADLMPEAQAGTLVYADALLNDGVTSPAIDVLLSPIININTVELDGDSIEEWKGYAANKNLSKLSSLLGGTHQIGIGDGILKRLDQFTGAKIQNPTSRPYSVAVSNLPIIGSITLKVVVSTSASTMSDQDFALPSEFKRATSGTTNFKGDTAQAADTYGLVLDFWVRTNASNSYLTLEGAPTYNEYEEPVKVQVNGNNLNLYTFVATIDGQEVTFEGVIDADYVYEYFRDTKAVGGQICASDDPCIKSRTEVTETKQELVGYNGVNRVWDMEADTTGALTDNSTTMGTGSCYVFYPKNADDQEKSIQLLSNMRVAFISKGEDGNTVLLGEAVMDTQHAVEQAGKVTIPLVCSQNCDSIQKTNSEGVTENVYYITSLDANIPTMVTALLYVDGTNLSNDQVLATNDIQGHLNIQFGTTEGLSALNDPVLREEKCYIEATMTDSANSTTLTNNEIGDSAAARTKHIAISVEGNKPALITAYFQRVINNTQGIRQQKIVFNDDDGDGVWTASYTFEAAGDYILREVLLDGVTYELDSEPIAYTLGGYTVNALYFSSASGLRSGETYATTAYSFDAEVELQFTRSGGDPVAIRGAFIHQGTKNRTTVLFKKVGDVWRGTANFTTSGEYVLERLDIDDVEDSTIGLPEETQLSLNLFLGVTIEVDAAKTSFGLTDQAVKTKMFARVKADDNTVFDKLTNFQLSYSRNGLTSDANRLVADMTWDAQNKRYQGEFEITQAGNYAFWKAEFNLNNVPNILTAAKRAPVLTAISTDIPSYSSKGGFGSAFALNNDYYVSVTLKDAASATVDAKIVDADGNAYYVRGYCIDNGDKTQTFRFTLPVKEGSGQSGTWTLQEIYLAGVCTPSGTILDHSTENGPLPRGDENLGNRAPYTVDEDYYRRWWTWTQAELGGGEADDFSISVVSSLDISFVEEGKTIQYGMTDGEVTGTFGTSYEPANVIIRVLANGQPLSAYGLNLDSATLKYKVNINNSFGTYNSSTYESKLGGGFRVAKDTQNETLHKAIGLTNNTLVFGSPNITDNGDGTYTLSTNQSISMAAVYEAVAGGLSIKVSGSGVTKEYTDANALSAPRFEVYSKKPVATITGISPENSVNTQVTWVEKENSGVTFTYTNPQNNRYSPTSAELYARAYEDSIANMWTTAKFEQPTLSITLSGMGEASTATMLLPAGTTGAPAITYEYTADGEITQTLGKTEQIADWTICSIGYYLTAYYGHGDVEIDQIVMTTQSGVSVTFIIDPLRIKNPDSINQYP